ncbi:hypothetical protein E4T56_gene1090 [Termitomyces sp. T112]|nr:hypothetical protein E4T56_gene1090 [Termitomyces sp. T112]KAH0579295.1 hypothetical protein H2248_003440 [Termitomyces sp. 'cryptogamus']
MFSSIFLFVSLAVAAVQALNDWSKPCLSGVCSYDLPDSTESSSGSLKIWGSRDAISDITVAAGWNIINCSCSSDELAQDVRLVCNNDDPVAAGCSHLYEGSGAEGKIVRLPESCGKNAFARVARAWIPDDQSIPESISGKIVRRNDSRPQVKALTLDTNFSAVDPSKAGPVNFAVQGANVKGASADIDISSMNGNVERDLTGFVGNAIDSIKNLDTFNFNKSLSPQPFGIDRTVNLFNESVSCPPNTASLTVDANANATVAAIFGVAASGRFFPFRVNDFAMIIRMSGDIDSSVTMKATASGTLERKLPIFGPVGIPELNFRGVFTIGPTFEVNGQVSAELDLEADMTVGLNYHFDNAELVFPDDKTGTAGNSNSFAIDDTPLKLSVSPSVKATGNVQAHLIPSLNLSVSAHKFGTGIFLNLDAFAEMDLSLEGTSQTSVTVDEAKREGPRTIGRYMRRAALVAVDSPTVKDFAPVTVSGESTVEPTAAVTSSVASSANSSTTVFLEDSGASLGGCFNVTVGLDVNAGADADFFGLFDENTQVSLFNKTFELFEKCFNNQKRSLAVNSSLASASLTKPTELTCPTAGSASSISVIDQVVKAGTIRAVPKV